MNRIKWIKKEFEWLAIRCIHAVTGNYIINLQKYAGVGIHTAVEGNEFIYNSLLSKKSFAVGRCSFSEIGYMTCVQNERYFHSNVHYYWTPSYINGIKTFDIGGDYKKGLHRFDELMRDSMEIVDGIGTWPSMVMCDAVLELQPNIDSKFIFNADAVSPFVRNQIPWTKALEGKRVLVVCPFAEDIVSQYEKKDLIWKNGELPQIELLCDPSIWYGDDNLFNNWFEAFDYLTDRVLSREFDVALLGCGQFGFPLAARIKKAGRSAIHMGGATQLLFGLKGKRWDNEGIYNDYWIRPNPNTKPSFANVLDGATYW